MIYNQIVTWTAIAILAMFYGLGRFYPVLSHAVQKFYRWMSGTKSILFDLASSNKTFAKKEDEIGRREGGGGRVWFTRWPLRDMKGRRGTKRSPRVSWFSFLPSH